MKNKVLILSALLLLIVLLFISSIEKPLISGKIEKINFNTNYVQIKINSIEVILFSPYIQLKENDSIDVFGIYDTTNNSKIIAEKIVLIK